MSARSTGEDELSGHPRPPGVEPQPPVDMHPGETLAVTGEHGRRNLAAIAAAREHLGGHTRPLKRRKPAPAADLRGAKDRRSKTEDQVSKYGGVLEDLCRPRVDTPPQGNGNPLTARGRDYSGPLGAEKTHLARLAESISQPVRELVEVWLVAGEHDQTGGVRPAMQFVLRHLEDEGKIIKSLKSVVNRSVQVEIQRGRYPASWAWQDFAERLAAEGVNGYRACASDDHGARSWAKLAADIEAGRDVWGTHEP